MTNSSESVDGLMGALKNDTGIFSKMVEYIQRYEQKINAIDV